ncbi:helix-turn-helix domain-containing protein [Flavobacterium sp.]|uniref:helix-turn-helix domain-containing protein n=1 Tax=Flavobacterium sp. TaxID=239 RepID=UPI0037530E34
MKKEIIQIENINAEEFKDEIIKGVIMALKELNFKFQNSDEDQILTREEAAKMLSVSFVTLWSWDKKDILQTYRIGNKIRYKKSDLLNALTKKNKF